LSLEHNVTRLARLELPGAGQVTVEGKHAYVGHITNKERLGTSILDVSDPRKPRLLTQIFLDEGGSHSHKARVAGDLMIVNVEQNMGPAGHPAERGGLEPREQLGRSASPRVGVLGQELSEAAFAEARGAVRGGIPAEECQGDGRGDVGKDCRGARPESVEQRAQLIAERHALGHQSITAAHEGAQRAGGVGRDSQGAQATTIGAEHVGQDEGIPWIGLGARRRVARAGGLQRVGVNRDDAEAGVDERIHEQPRRPLEGDADLRRRREALEPSDKFGEAGGRVGDGGLPPDAAGAIDHARRVGFTRPIDTNVERHCVPPWDGETLRGERSCRSLTDRRSGLAWHVALHPVAGLGLSSFHPRERVSYWPSRGERRWLSPNVIAERVVQ
jgi:hypothetical protein